MISSVKLLVVMPKVVLICHRASNGCFTNTMNPEAPGVALVGGGPRIMMNAEKLAALGRAIPVFMKRDTNQWEYMDRYKLIKFSKDPTNFESKVIAADRNDVAADSFSPHLIFRKKPIILYGISDIYAQQLDAIERFCGKRRNLGKAGNYLIT